MQKHNTNNQGNYFQNILNKIFLNSTVMLLIMSTDKGMKKLK